VGARIAGRGSAETFPQRVRQTATHAAKNAFIANVRGIKRIVTERESQPTRIEARQFAYGNVESVALGARSSWVSGSFSTAEKEGSVFTSFMDANPSSLALRR